MKTPDLPVEHIFWLIPDKLAGRPGPDRRPWDLAALRAAGFGAVLSVNDGLSCNAEEFAAQGIEYACIPLSRNIPPEPGDDEVCIRALPKTDAFVEEQLANERRVLVHCSGGQDRTGLVLCYFLMRREHLSPAQAMERVRQVRPTALGSEGWEEFALRVLEHFAEARR